MWQLRNLSFACIVFGAQTVLHAAPLAYVASSYSCNVSVVDTASATVVSIITPTVCPLGVAANPLSNRVYMTSKEGELIIIDAVSNTVRGYVLIGHNPRGIAVTRDGSKVYIVTFDAVVVFDVASEAVISRIPLAGGQYVAVNAAGTRVYVSTGGAVAVIDTVTDTVTELVSVGTNPQGLAVTPDDSRLYVSNQGTVSVIDTATNTTVADIPAGGFAGFVAVHPNGRYVYVTTTSSLVIYVIDTTTNSIVAAIADDEGPWGASITPDGSRLYVGDIGGTVSVIDTSANEILEHVPVGLESV